MGNLWNRSTLGFWIRLPVVAAPYRVCEGIGSLIWINWQLAIGKQVKKTKYCINDPNIFSNSLAQGRCYCTTIGPGLGSWPLLMSSNASRPRAWRRSSPRAARAWLIRSALTGQRTAAYLVLLFKLT